MNVLLTGATGLVGSAILSSLNSLGIVHTFAITRNRSQLSDNSNTTWISGDISKDLSFLEGLPKISVLIHAAAQLPSKEALRNPSLMFSTNIIGSSQLFSKLADIGIESILYLSGFNFLSKPLLLPINERHPVAPTNFYALCKYWTELELFSIASKNNIRAVSFRISSPVPNTFKQLPNTVLKTWINQAINERKIKVFGTGERRQDFVSTTDIASAICSALCNDRVRGVYNIARGESVRMIDVAHFLSKTLSAEICFTNGDGGDDENWNIDIAKAQEEIGYKPSLSIYSCLQRIIENYHENCNIE
jgi:nucleoside-diphosphate-sugar epimerase